MHAIKAIWKGGQILPTEPVDRPDGSELRVEPIDYHDAKIGLTAEEWRDDPVAIADWIAAVNKLEPMIWAEGEREEYERFREESRRFNLEAVRKQMEEKPTGDEP